MAEKCFKIDKKRKKKKTEERLSSKHTNGVVRAERQKIVCGKNMTVSDTQRANMHQTAYNAVI